MCHGSCKANLHWRCTYSSLKVRCQMSMVNAQVMGSWPISVIHSLKVLSRYLVFCNTVVFRPHGHQADGVLLPGIFKIIHFGPPTHPNRIGSIVRVKSQYFSMCYCQEVTVVRCHSSENLPTFCATFKFCWHCGYILPRIIFIVGLLLLQDQYSFIASFNFTFSCSSRQNVKLQVVNK